MSVAGLFEAMDLLGSDDEIDRTLFGVVQIQLRGKGPAVEEMARSLAGSFDGTLDELMAVAELIERNTRYAS